MREKKRLGAELVKYDFRGDVLDVVKHGAEIDVGVRSVCDAIGVGYNGQIEKLKADEEMGVRMIRTPSAGGPQETACARRARRGGAARGPHP